MMFRPGESLLAPIRDTRSVWKLLPHLGISVEGNALVDGSGFRLCGATHGQVDSSTWLAGPMQQIGPETKALDIRDQAKVL